VTLDGGVFQSGAAGLAFNNAFAISTTGGTIDTQANTLTLFGPIGNGNGTTGVLTKIGSGTLVLAGANTYSGGTVISSGILEVGGIGTSIGSGPVTLNGGTFEGPPGTHPSEITPVTFANPFFINTAGGTIATQFGPITLTGTISNGDGTTGVLTKAGIGTLVLTGNNTYTGGTVIEGGDLQLGNGGTSGSILGNVTNNGNSTLVFNRSDNFAFSGTISGTGTLEQAGPGTLTLPVTETYSGSTVVGGGTLEVDGSIAHSSLTTIFGGAALTGVGTVGNVQVNTGGTFAPGSGTPGTSMMVSGNLAFQSGAMYLVQISPSSASSATVTGTASLTGATANAQFVSGSYVAKQYDILHSGGLNGSTFAALGTTNLPAGFAANLSYTPTDVLLNLTATLGQPGFSALGTSGLNVNQQNVATSLNNFFNGGGTLPPNFLSVFGLTGGNLATALTQLSGEAATDSEVGAFKLMDQFLVLMLDPFVDGRSGTGWPGGGWGSAKASGFAPEEQPSLPPDVALAYAAVLKAPKSGNIAPNWSAWGSGFGGSNTTNGDAVVGSNTVTAHDYGFAGGLDYHFSPDTVAGFALAGGGTTWGLAQGFGGGRSGAFEAGVYGATRSGPAYVAAALAFANHWMTTNRIALSDQLSASFNGQSYAGRLEAGYRYATLSTIGITPYAALQAQSFHTPNYSETDLTSGGFGLSYNAMTGTDTRSELGARFDDMTMLYGMPLSLRARAAWAHDWATNPALDAAFQALPGASFIVSGATPPMNSALLSAGAELHVTRSWSVAAKFDGEFASGSSTYAGTGTLRYQW
jgi:autotransporter-associated beta strand protein